jgi:hypothetical protein
MKYQRVYLKNQKISLIKKYGFQTDKAFEEVAQDMGLIPNKSGLDIGFERHPWRIVEERQMIFVIPSSILKMESIWVWFLRILL